MPGLPYEVKVELLMSTGVASLWSAGAWSDVTDYVRAFRTNRGRQYETDIAEPGTLELELDNSDSTFDPDNTAGPFYGYIRPNRRVRVSVRQTVFSSRVYLFTGYVDSWRHTWPGGGAFSVATVSATDRFKLYARRTNTGTTVAEKADARLKAILDGIGVDPSEYSLNPDGYNSRNLVAFPYGNTNTLDALADVVQSDGGLLYINGSGVTVFQSTRYRLDNVRANITQSTWGNNPGDVPIEVPEPTVDSQLMANRITCTDGTGALRIANDPVLVIEDGLMQYDLGSTLLQPLDAQDRIEDLLLLRKTPKPRYGALTLDALTDDQALTQALYRELSDRITVSIQPQGGGTLSSRPQYIESIGHDVSLVHNAVSWTTTYNVSAV